MENACSRHSFLCDQRKLAKEMLFVSDRHKYIYCNMPKVAGTSWKVVLLSLEGRDYSKSLVIPGIWTTIGRFLKQGDVLKPLDLRNRLKKYYKFMFVREPLERLLSAYRDKCVRSNHKGIRQEIRKRRKSGNKGN